MKALLLIAMIIVSSCSCKKYIPPTPIYCWECNMDGNSYTPVGCMTVDEFHDRTFYDGMGNPVSKSNCQMKH